MRRATWLKNSMVIEKPIAAYRYPFGIWKPKPSATRLRPIISRKLRQSTTTVGCWFTKRVSGFEASSITIIAMTTAAIITGRWLTIPTAVMTASSEKTASSTTICNTTTQKLA